MEGWKLKLIVFGASGHCGSHLVRLGANRGHRVTAVTRGASKYAPPDGVTLVQGDVLDAAFVAAVIRGHDAVASCLGMRYRHPWATRESPDDFTSRATAHIAAGMQAAGVSRLSVISAGGVGDSRRALNWPMRLLLRTSNVGVAYENLERVEHILRESRLDWQAVRPTTLTHRAASARIRVTTRYPATAMIPREDVAAFMLRELESPRFSARTPMITAG
jgi:putative NADH-flavin reductase